MSAASGDSGRVPPRQTRPIVHEAVWAPMILLAFAVARWFPFGKISFPLCVFKQLTSLPCPACGGTRSVTGLVHGDVLHAFTMNPLVFLVSVAAAAYVLHALRVAWTRKPWRPVVSPAVGRILRIAAVVALVGNWAYLLAVGR